MRKIYLLLLTVFMFEATVNGQPVDVSAQAITGIPVSNCPNASVPIAVTVKNESGTTLDFSANNLSISVSITGASTQTLTATINTGSLAAGASQSFPVSPAANLSINGVHNFSAVLTLAGETALGNNTVNASKPVNGEALATLPHTVNFTGYNGSNIGTLFTNWSEASGTTPAGTTSIWTNQSSWSPANTTASVNLYTNLSNEWIISPKFTATANTQLYFDIAITEFGNTTADNTNGMQGTDDKVVVKISTDCGVNFSDLFTFNAANTAGISNVLTAQNINLSAYAGQTVIIAFVASDGPVDDVNDYDFHLDNINILNVYPTDAGATALALPATTGCYGAAEAVSVTVKNYGTLTLDFSVTPITVTTNVTGATTATLTATLNTGTLAANATINVPMSTTLNMTTAGTYTFNAFTTITGDGNVSNDAMPAANRTPSTLAGGVYTVGAAGTYTTITAAVAAYNSATCITGPVVFNLVDNNYSAGETFPITINTNGAASSTNTLTIKATQANTTISGSNSSAIFILNGADYITIDGSTGSTVNTVCPVVAASRDLTITNTNTGTNSAVIWLQTAGLDGAANNTIKNCNVAGNSNTTTLIGIGAGGPTIGSGTGANGNNNNSIINNNISKVQIGIFTSGSGAATKNTTNIINQNLMNTVSPDNVGRIGIMALFEEGITVSGNTISEIISSASQDVIGISIGVNGISTTTLEGGESTNATVTNNIVGTVQQTNTYSAAGIAVQATAGGTTIIANNMISGVNANGTSTDFAAGILVGGSTVSATKVYNNSVTMTGTFTGGQQASYALAIHGSSDPVIDLRNNILTSTGNTGANLNRAIGTNSSTVVNMASDRNDLYVSGTGAAIAQTATLAGIGGTTHTTLANWQTNTGSDANSKNVNPTFVSATNLHLLSTDATNFTNLEGKGDGTIVSPGNKNNNDIDCQARSATTPDIGADEYTGSMPACGDVTGLAASGITTTSVNLSWTAVGGATGYEYAVTTSATPPASGTATALTAVSPGSLNPSTIYYAHVRSNCGGGSFGNWATISFTTLCAPFTIPYTQNFDGVTAPVLPVCTSVEDLNGATTWATSTINPRSAPNSLTYSFDAVLPGNDWFFTAPLALTGGTSYRLTFWYRARSFATPESFEVKYGTDTATIVAGGIVLKNDTTVDNEDYESLVIDFTPGATNTYYIGFHCKSIANQFDLHLDDISVNLTPSCSGLPSAVTVLASNSTDATLSWTAASPAPANGYVWKIVATGANVNSTPVASGTTAAGVTTANVAGLTAGTTYDLYVLGHCGGTDSSVWVGPRKFFLHDDAAGALPLVVGAGCTGAVYNNIGAKASAGEVTNNAYPSCSGSIIAPVWFKFTAPASGAVRISTDLGTGVTFNDSKLALFAATNPNDYSTFTILSCDEDGGSSTAVGSGFGYMSVLYMVGLTSGQTYYIAVDKFSNSTANGNFCIAVDELNSTMLASNTTASCTANEFSLGTNNNYTGWVPLVVSDLDGGSKLIAMVRNASGGAVENYDSLYVNLNPGAVRTDASGRHYLNRNFHISNQSVSNVDVQFFFTRNELIALKNADPAVTLANLGAGRQLNISDCQTNFSGSASFLSQTYSDSVNGACWIRVNTPGFSNFFLHTSKAPVAMKTFLQGAYDATVSRHRNVSTVWRDVLRNNATSQPFNAAAFGNYNGGETVPTTIFNSTSAATDITDWVLLELRNAAPPAAPIATRAAFILEDGSIVDLDGTSSAAFRNVPEGNYYISIRHRNHLGIRSRTVQPLNGTLGASVLSLQDYSADSTKIFRDNSIATNDPVAIASNGPIFLMWGGNANQDNFIRVTTLFTTTGDPVYILGSVLLGNPNTVLSNVYSPADVNMDGTVRINTLFTTTGERPFILGTAVGGNPNGSRREHK